MGFASFPVLVFVFFSQRACNGLRGRFFIFTLRCLRALEIPLFLCDLKFSPLSLREIKTFCLFSFELFFFSRIQGCGLCYISLFFCFLFASFHFVLSLPFPQGATPPFKHLVIPLLPERDLFFGLGLFFSFFPLLHFPFPQLSFQSTFFPPPRRRSCPPLIGLPVFPFFFSSIIRLLIQILPDIVTKVFFFFLFAVFQEDRPLPAFFYVPPLRAAVLLLPVFSLFLVLTAKRTLPFAGLLGPRPPFSSGAPPDVFHRTSGPFPPPHFLHPSTGDHETSCPPTLPELLWARHALFSSRASSFFLR